MTVGRSQPKSKFEYVGSQQGWKILFFSFAFSSILGLGIRLYLSPEMVTRRLHQALSRKHKGGPGAQYEIGFQSAHLELARGAVPLVAFILTDVTFTPDPACEKLPAVKIARLTVPLSFTALFEGRLRVGDNLAENVVLDLDRLRKRCDAAPLDSKSKKERPSGPVGAVVSASGAANGLLPNLVRPPVLTERVQPWWTKEQFESLRSLVSKIDLRHVEILFETHPERSSPVDAKKVLLDEFSLSLEPNEEAAHMSAFLRMPPEVTFGENLPPFRISADAKENSAEVRIKGELSEGTLEGFATLKPGPQTSLEIQARVSVSEIPLSTTVPMLKKAGWVRGVFQPKFVWLSCSASIKGRFQGLVKNEPLFVERCKLVGRDSEIAVDSATRAPDGSWSAIKVNLRRLDLRNLLETFGERGPEGVASDFGEVGGVLDIESPNEAKFQGTIEGVQIHFSNRKLRAVQAVSRMDVEAAIHGPQMTGEVKQMDIQNGQFKGYLRFQTDREFRRGKINIHLDDFALDPEVQKVLVDGAISQFRGDGEANLVDGRLSGVSGDWFAARLATPYLHLLNGRFKTEYKSDVKGGDFQVTLKAPRLELSREFATQQNWRKLFFGHEFLEDWIPLLDLTAHLTVSETKGVQWEKSSAFLNDHSIAMQTSGTLARDKKINGTVGLDFPKLKHLRWTFSGTSDSSQFVPSFSETEPKIQALIAVSGDPIKTDALLGLPKKISAADKDKPTNAQVDSVAGAPENAVVEAGRKSKERIEQLGREVLEKAKKIVPQSGGANESE